MQWLGRVLAAIVAAAVTASAAGSEPVAPADAIRGGWIAEVEGVRHIFILKVREATVSGIYCAVDCGDPSRLVFVDRGTLTPQGVRLQLLRMHGRSSSRTDVVGRLVDGHLLLTLTPSAGARAPDPRRLDLQRDPRRPATVTVEELFARRGIQSGPLVISGSAIPYVPAGPNEALAPAVLEGLWVWGNGSTKQHFMFRQVGERVLGAVCGPCDNPYTFGVLDDVVIRGDTVTFDINHEDWGIGIEFGPFANHGTATLSRHELHLHTVQHNGARTVEGDLVLTGPLQLER